MNEIVRSRDAMLFAALGAALAALGEVAGVIGFAVLNINSPGTFTDLSHAHDWLLFGGSLLALGAVGLVAWRRIAEDQGRAVLVGAGGLELGGATVATLFIALGSLVSAASSGSSAGDTLSAVGIGLWGLLALVRSGRLSLADRTGPPGSGMGRLTTIWVAVAAGLILLAIGYGISFGASSQGASIASGVIGAIGLGVWAAAVADARNHGLLSSPLVPRVLAALGLAAASFLAEAVVAGIVFGPSGTVTGLQVGGAVIDLLLGLSIAVFGHAAWLQVGGLPVPARAATRTAPAPSAPSPAAGEPAGGEAEHGVAGRTAPGPGARSCLSCAAPVPEGARYCPSCGAEAAAAP